MAFPFLAATTDPHALEQRLVAVLIQLAIIIAVARVFAGLFRRIGQPAVVGEIIAGLILGPSLFGRIPWLQGPWGYVFNPPDPGVGMAFDILKELGLIFLLFLIGLEFDFGHLKTHNKSALGISVAGVVAPFGLGVALALWMHAAIPEAQEKSKLGFVLFIGTAMSITAIPILGRIMMEMGITRTRLGAITITAAAIDDATGWILLATVSAIVKAEFDIRATLQMLGLSLGFAALMIWGVRPLLKRWIRYAVTGGNLGLNALAVVFILMFLCAIATAKVGIFAIFGAFLLGAVLSDEHEFRDAVAARLHQFVTVFFLPIFFTYTGLRTEVGTLNSGMLWMFAALVSAVAILGKFGGCTLAARLGGFSNRESACIGVMMNTRALMELIVINAGYNLGVIPRSVFVMLVFMAVLTTIMTSPILLRLVPGTELEPYVAESGFRGRRPEPRDLEVVQG